MFPILGQACQGPLVEYPALECTANFGWRDAHCLRRRATWRQRKPDIPVPKKVGPSNEQLSTAATAKPSLDLGSEIRLVALPDIPALTRHIMQAASPTSHRRLHRLQLQQGTQLSVPNNPRTILKCGTAPRPRTGLRALQGARLCCWRALLLLRCAARTVPRQDLPSYLLCVHQVAPPRCEQILPSFSPGSIHY